MLCCFYEYFRLSTPKKPLHWSIQSEFWIDFSLACFHCPPTRLLHTLHSSLSTSLYAVGFFPVFFYIGFLILLFSIFRRAQNYFLSYPPISYCRSLSLPLSVTHFRQLDLFIACFVVAFIYFLLLLLLNSFSRCSRVHSTAQKERNTNKTTHTRRIHTHTHIHRKSLTMRIENEIKLKVATTTKITTQATDRF